MPNVSTWRVFLVDDVVVEPVSEAEHLLRES